MAYLLKSYRLPLYAAALLACLSFQASAGVQEDFIWAVEKGNLSDVSRLLEKGANPDTSNREGYTPLMIAAKEKNLKLVVDNTFSPLIVSPIRLGADIVIHSMTKFINGTSDCVAGAVCASDEFIHKLTDINSGAAMLLGPVLDSARAASILKNLHSLHLRMRQHSANAQFLAEKFKELGLKVFYPGLPEHPQFELLNSMMNKSYGYGGMLALDVGTLELANKLMALMQKKKVGYLAVSLGYFKTLFSPPGHSTSSEIPKEERDEIGLSEGLIRFSIGLDNDIHHTFERIKKCLQELKII